MNKIDVFSLLDSPITSAPLSADGSCQYIHDLNTCMKMLLNVVKKDGHLNEYWLNVQKENDRARMAAWRVKVERDKIAMASAYNSDMEENELDSMTSEEEESDWSMETTEYESDEVKMFDASPLKEKQSEESCGTPEPSMSFGNLH